MQPPPSSGVPKLLLLGVMLNFFSVDGFVKYNWPSGMKGCMKCRRFKKFFKIMLQGYSHYQFNNNHEKM